MFRKLKNNKLVQLLGFSFIMCLCTHVIPLLIVIPIVGGSHADEIDVSAVHEYCTIENHLHCEYDDSISNSDASPWSEIGKDVLMFVLISIPVGSIGYTVYKKLKKQEAPGCECGCCDHSNHDEEDHK